MVPTRILIVDDDAEIRRSLRKCFEGAGYFVAEADSIDATRAALASDTFHLVTVDVNLDGPAGAREDGKALALEIRSKYRCGIIMLSVITDRGERNNWLQDSSCLLAAFLADFPGYGLVRSVIYLPAALSRSCIGSCLYFFSCPHKSPLLSNMSTSCEMISKVFSSGPCFRLPD